MSQKDSFVTGGIFRPLFRFMVPLLFANFLQALYSAGDMFIIGIFGTTGDVSAVSTGTGVVDLVRMFLSACSTGITVLLGQQLGQRKADGAGRVVGAGAWLFGLVGLVFTLILFIPAPLMANVMQAPAEAFDSTVLYIRICALGTVFVALYNVLCAVFRGLGDSTTPMIIAAVSFVLNFLADCVLVGHFKLGAGGSAMTNVFAQALSVFLGVLVIKKKGLPFPFKRDMIRWNKPCAAAITKVGIPLGGQDVLVSISFLAITAIINSLGLVYSAGAGVAEKAVAFILLIPSSFSQAVSTFVAHNIGARKVERAVKGMRYGMIFSFVCGVFIGALSFFRGDLLVGFFVSGKPDVLAAGTDYLKAYAFDCILTAILFCFHGFFIGVGRTKFVALEGVAGAFLIRIPLSFLLSRIQPVSLFYVALAVPCSSVFQNIACFIYYRCIMKHPEELKPMGDEC